MVIVVAFQVAGFAAMPLNVTVLVPWLAPKLLPAMVTLVPTFPEVGVMVLIAGGVMLTVNPVPLVA